MSDPQLQILWKKEENKDSTFPNEILSYNLYNTQIATKI